MVFQKGKFYTLPIVDIRYDDVNAYFIVLANEREYAIRMFAFQKNDPEMLQLPELPVMVKDVHGDNLILVQNFAAMFGNKYDPEESYQFVVSRLVSTLPDGKKYYDVFDIDGVPFRLKTPGNVYLQPRQRISCKVLHPSANKLELLFESKRRSTEGQCISPAELLKEAGIESAWALAIGRIFENNEIFEEARKLLERRDPEWVIKALMAVPGVEKWKGVKPKYYSTLLTIFNRLCLYVLEDSRFMLLFDEAEREDFQEWITRIIENIEIYRECLDLIQNNSYGEEIDSILRKIRNSGYIYNPQRKMALLIAIFSMKPEILEERIDTILDIIAESAQDWKLPSFKKAFSSFMQFYIMTNRDSINRLAFVEDDHTTQLLHRMVRAICYFLLMSDGKEVDLPMYKSMLFHYLSFVRSKNVLGQRALGISMSDSLLEQAFYALVSSETKSRELSWDMNFGQTELFAYQMSLLKSRQTTFTTRAFETDKIRFAVSTDGMTIARAASTGRERNVLPNDFLPWHNIQLFLDNPTKYPITPSSKISTWKNWWKKVELALFEDRLPVANFRRRKVRPEVGNEVTVRVLRQEFENPNRFYCRIEDDEYEGEGWLDSYIIGGTTGMFHYNPRFNTECFQLDGKPLLFKVRVVGEDSPYNDDTRFYFDAMTLLDDFIRGNVEYGQESDCHIIYHDERYHVMLGITEYGYGVFFPDHTADMEYAVGDTVHVRVTDPKRVQSIQAEVVGPAMNNVNVTLAASQLLQDYADLAVYEETDAELAEEAMSVSEDQFDVEYISQLICLLDHKAVVEEDNAQAYGYLSVAHILASMINDEATARYLDQRRSLLIMLEDYGKNNKVDDAELDRLSSLNADIVDKFPVLKQRLCEIKIVNSFGKQENNSYLWELASNFGPGHIIGKLARLTLSYNMADGFNLSELQNKIVAEIKQLLKINIELPVIYSFGQETQTREFKSSIVFPPENGMQPNLEEQTFNILKVIAGMVNAYGGTLYLGVYDTGTAKGLADDLPFFENSRDKFDLYVRNQIRLMLGDAVNASIRISHPEAGNHWIYAIHVAPSKVPVKLRSTGQYFLREGSSTYRIDDEQQLREIMDNRDFSRFPIENDVVISETDYAESESARAASEKEAKEKNRQGDNDEVEKISTSRLRTNITDNWVEGYGVDTCSYFRVHDNNEWSRLDDVEWDEGLLTLAIHNAEKDGFMILVYDDGKILKVPMQKIMKESAGSRHKMLAGKTPVFVAPARREDALLTTYYDDKGKIYYRLDDLSEIEETKITERGNTLSDVDFNRMGECEIIPAEHVEELKRMRNLKRTSLGFQLSAAYGKEEKAYLEKIGL